MEHVIVRKQKVNEQFNIQEKICPEFKFSLIRCSTCTFNDKTMVWQPSGEGWTRNIQTCCDVYQDHTRKSQNVKEVQLETLVLDFMRVSNHAHQNTLLLQIIY